MKKILTFLLLLILVVFDEPNQAKAALVVYPPVLEKVVINADSMQAVLYWRATHSAPDNPVIGYVATYNGSAYVAISNSLAASNVSIISLPFRANADPYIFSVSAVTKNGIGPSSNRITSSINPYTIPLKVSSITSSLGGFSFRIEDFSMEGHSTKNVVFSVTDIEGSDGAYLETAQNYETVKIAGVKRGEKVSVTLYKNVTICEGFVVQHWCPYSSFKIIEGTALEAIPVPICVEVISDGAGYSCQLGNYDQSVNYSVETPEGVDASVKAGGLLYVTGVKPSATATVRVIAQYPSYPPVEMSISGRSTREILPLALSEAIPTHEGFYVRVLNYDSEYEYQIESSRGKPSIDDEGVIEVRGLAAKERATLTIKASLGADVVSEMKVDGIAKPQRFRVKKR